MNKKFPKHKERDSSGLKHLPKMGRLQVRVLHASSVIAKDPEINHRWILLFCRIRQVLKQKAGRCVGTNRR